MPTTTLTPADVRAYYSARIPNLRTAGDEWRCACPLHQGDRDSLAINAETGLWFCHSECGEGGSVFEFEQRLNFTSFDEAVRAVGKTVGRDLLLKDPAPRAPTTPEIVYQYQDADGSDLFQVVRRPGKDFRQRRWNPVTGKWAWTLKAIPEDQPGGPLAAVKRVIYRLPEVVAAGTVYLVEGEKDADNLRRLGVVATTTPGGADNWRPAYARYFRDKSVIILPDNDEPGAKYAATAGRDIRGVARDLRIVQLPGLPAKGDVSDWIDAGGTLTELTALVAEKPVVGDPRPAKAERRSLNSEVAITAQALAANVMHDAAYLADRNHNLYRYEDSRWVMLTPGETTATILQYDNLETTTSRRRNEAAKYILDTKLNRDIPWGALAPYEVGVRNGVLDLRHSTLRPHRPDDYLQALVPWEFDPAAHCPTWLRTLDQWFPTEAEKVAVLQEFSGYLLFHRAHIKKCLILLGEPDCGKSVFADIMVELVGRSQMCSISPTDMDNPRKLAPIRGKMLNIMSELPREAMIAEGGFKRMISGGSDVVQIDPKFKDEESYIPIAKHIFVMNTLPIIQDETMATMKRMIVVRFPISIPDSDQDHFLFEKIKAEMPGVLAWAVHGAARLYEQGNQFTEIPESRELLLEHRAASNPVFDFVGERLEETGDPGDFVSDPDFRRRFREWYGPGSRVSDAALRRWKKQAGMRNAAKHGVRGVSGYRWKSIGDASTMWG